MGWWKRKVQVPQAGSALFRGRWVARPEQFVGDLEARGVRMGPAQRGEGGEWSAPLEHPAWGRATLRASPELPLPPAFLVDMDCRLNDDEKEAVKGCGFCISVIAEPRTGDVLVDRKDLLRFLHAVMGAEGVAAVDHTSQAFWSRQGLEDELAHDAALDIDAIYTMHVLGEGEDEARSSYWLHSHGLSEIGFLDFDVLEPSPAAQGRGHDLFRALAYGVVEGRLAPGAEPMPLMDRERVIAVPSRQFLSGLPAGAYPKYRESLDESHIEGHAVVCAPAPTGWFQRLFRGPAHRPAGVLSGPMPDECLVHYSSSATELMARRARETLAVFREAAGELAEFEFPALVKLGYPVDGGGEDDREHLWFEVHRFEGDDVDATLTNAPFNIARLHQNDRGLHSLARLSDWVIFTPAGSVNPRQLRTLRLIREHRAELREALAKARAPG